MEGATGLALPGKTSRDEPSSDGVRRVPGGPTPVLPCTGPYKGVRVRGLCKGLEVPSGLFQSGDPFRPSRWTSATGRFGSPSLRFGSLLFPCATTVAPGRFPGMGVRGLGVSRQGRTLFFFSGTDKRDSLSLPRTHTCTPDVTLTVVPGKRTGPIDP